MGCDHQFKHAPKGQPCSRCGAPCDRAGRYCKACHAADGRERRRRVPRTLTRDAAHKAHARSITHVYVKRGKVAKWPCECCGRLEAEAHHLDYDTPLVVRWLCRPCHLHAHRDAAPPVPHQWVRVLGPGSKWRCLGCRAYWQVLTSTEPAVPCPDWVRSLSVQGGAS